MKSYEKPMLHIVELQVNETIAALVPKTVYKKSAGTSSFSQSSVAESDIAELETYGTSNQTA